MVEEDQSLIQNKPNMERISIMKMTGIITLIILWIYLDKKQKTKKILIKLCYSLLRAYATTFLRDQLSGKMVFIMEEKHMKEKHICIYTYQFLLNVQSILKNIEIVLVYSRKGFEKYEDTFNSFVKCIEEGNLDSYMKNIKARKEGIKASDLELSEIERLIADPDKGFHAKEMLRDMENLIEIFKDINYAKLKEFLFRSNIIYLFTEFENFLFKCMKFILLKYSEIMDQKSIRLKEIRLMHDSRNLKLIEEIIAENTIQDLLYKNYIDIFNYFKDPLGIELQFSQESIDKLNIFKEIRNFLTHGDGIINLLFLKRISNWNFDKYDLKLTNLKIGEKLIVGQQTIFNLFRLLNSFIIEIDRVMDKKFPELRFEIESAAHLFHQAYLDLIISKWKNVLEKLE